MLKSGLCIDKDLFRLECKSYYKRLFDAKSKYLKDEIAEVDTKQLFNIVKRPSSPNLAPAFPDHTSDVDLANAFGESFNNKIGRIVSSFSAATATGLPYAYAFPSN